MNDIALWIPAILLPVFCLIYSSTVCRAIYFPLPKGMSAKLRNQHTVFLAMLAALAIAAAFRIAEALGAAVFPAGILKLFQILRTVFVVLLLFLLARYIWALPKTDRKTAVMLAAVTGIGVLVQAVWRAPVALFFAAVSLFGCMVVLEGGVDSSENGMNERFRRIAMIAVALIFFTVIGINMALLLNLTRMQSDEIGKAQLDIIRRDLQDTLSSAEANLLHTAIRAEQLMEPGASRDAVEHLILDQRESMLADENFMNIYIAGRGWHFVPGFDAPPDFHAAERVWYLGAAEHPGQVFVSEPYKDANTGNMCFTISTLLSDKETVVAMDLNFSKVQSSIREMTSGQEQTAMIVTDSGLIVGYSDMSLVGERATEKLPEFSTVLSRVTASRAHENFRVQLGGRSCVIFSSETSNHWYLILSVSADTLYAEIDRQVASLTSVNLLMLLVAVVFYTLSTRNRLLSRRVMEKNQRYIGGFADQLRSLTGRVVRLGDAHLIQEEQEPEAFAGQIREAGEQLAVLADHMRSYSEALLLPEEEQKKRKRADSASLPSRITRIGVIATLLVILTIVMFFCIRIAADWGNAQLSREADGYEDKLDQWITEQTTILYMFTDTISAQPEIMDDFNTAVKWLDSVASHYPDISACYMANPYAEIPVIMNTGWIPGEDERPETRPWYRATERSANHMNISTPYFDAQTGNYCITFSRVVYGENDEFLGIFGIDFFLDKLMQVLGESYTSRGYAFLVDSGGVIINHPNKAYENDGVNIVNIEDTEYAEAYNSASPVVLRDYSGHFFSCLSGKADSGFTVIVAIRWWNIFGSILLMMLSIFALFAVCIVLIVFLINRLIRWQEGVNRQLVQAAEDAESANRAKSRFLSQMSHEIRTPMNAIIGLDSIALRDPDISPRTRDELEKIGASARHLLALINDILDMSRIESGRMELKEKEFSLREFLEQINIIINGQCEDKRLKYTCSVIGTPDERFVGDDLKLKQVLINILGNSVKFTDSPGSVSFSVEELDRQDRRCKMRFTITDTGIGMDKAFLSKLFEAFSQENDTSTNKYGGSGLGMAITKRMVDMMGGEILVESEKGVGSNFTVTVPLRLSLTEEKPELSAEEPAELTPVGGLHVLIAEDQEINAEVLSDLLEMEEMTSEWAADGQIAVEMFSKSEENHFDAILMDMRMPVMDGISATREIRKLKRPDAAGIPIIALTANAFEEDVKQCLEAGMNAHLSKPVDIDALKLTLGRLITERKQEGK
ncbi:MAG: response regulator [Clostridia bacterium]|nr:response regulator [Clostridia bacterium]